VDREIEAFRDKQMKREKAKIDLGVLLPLQPELELIITARAQKQLAVLEREPEVEDRRESLRKAKYEILKDSMPHLQKYWVREPDRITWFLS
jgi:hypothetical protein